MKKSTKRIAVYAVIMVMLICSGVPVWAAEQLPVSLNSVNIEVNGVKTVVAGESYQLENGAEVPYSIVYKGTTYLPMRKICEMTNREVEWIEKLNGADIYLADEQSSPAASKAAASKGSKQTISASLNSINIAIGNVLVGKEGTYYKLPDGTEVPYSISYKDTTYLPMRNICEMLVKEVTWDQQTKTVKIADMKSPVNYKAHSTTPDFGALEGKEPVNVWESPVKYDDGTETTMISYMYSAKEEDLDKYKQYAYVLLNSGYTYIKDFAQKIDGQDFAGGVYVNDQLKTVVYGLIQAENGEYILVMVDK